MFFNGYKAFRILDIFKVKRESKKGYTEGRSWSAISFRISGSSDFESDSGVCTAGAGSILFIPEGVAFLRKGGAEELIIIHLKCFECENEQIEAMNLKNSNMIQTCFCELYEKWNLKKPGYQNECTAMLYSILSKLKSEKSGSLPPYQSNMIAAGVDLINSDYDDPNLTVKRLADACNISAEYFRMLYKAEYGISPHKAIIDKRLEKARRLLQAGYFSIAVVASECGFPNVKYFSALFREKTKMTPREYRSSYN